MTAPRVGKYLRRWGLSFQRPDKRAVEQNPEALRTWLEEAWPAIRATAKTEYGEVLFADQVGIRSDQATSRTAPSRATAYSVNRSSVRTRSDTRSGCSTANCSPTVCGRDPIRRWPLTTRLWGLPSAGARRALVGPLLSIGISGGRTRSLPATDVLFRRRRCGSLGRSCGRGGPRRPCGAGGRAARTAAP
ncbi:helix-turn-helix domain-containing protein [Streptomyces sp. Qhu-G9]|uniref:helix-turn-helix domain-containing protein n=1 Tax=Streptomyces sp. Qhu-G9 TaxID=3452799 RepID=UPI003AF97878